MKEREFKFYNHELLEWKKVCEFIASFASSRRVKEGIKNAMPCPGISEDDFRYLRDLLNVDVDEIPLGGNEDIKECVERAMKGGLLTGRELLSIASFIRNSISVKNYIRSKKELMENFWMLMKDVEVPLHVMRDIYACIDNQGNLYDTVDEELLKARKTILALREKVEKVHRRMYEENPRLFQDEYITIRHERFVFPIKVEEKGWVDGIIHGRSSTGETYFVEPVELVPINNEIRMQEEKVEEIHKRFFSKLSREVAEEGEKLKRMVEILELLEESIAKRKFMIAVKGCIPALRGEGLKLRGLRHPLLIMHGIEAVPNDVEMDGEARCMVVSGPNAGGKTVLLKALGTAIALAYAGFPVPCESAEIGDFSGIFIETGDPQNIYFGLSTFSGHLRNLKEIYESANGNGLILLDEAFSGTNPREADAFLTSYVEELVERKNFVIITTHSPDVMAWAETRKECFNFGMGWDPEKFSPTYRGRKGITGISASFQLAGRLNFPPSVIKRAAERAGRSAELQLLFEKFQKGLVEIEMKEALLREREVEMEKRERELRDKMEKEWKKAREKIREEIRKAKRELKEMLESARKEKKEEEIKGLMRKVEEISGKYEKPHRPLSRTPSPGEILFIPFLKTKGVVVAYNEKKETVDIEIGGKRITIPLSFLSEDED